MYQQKKRALVITGGALKGSYDAGVASVLCTHLGHDYFDTVYGCSSGAYIVSFYTANQPYEMIQIWKNALNDGKLISLSHVLRGKNVLDLEYLIGTFSSGEYKLDFDKALSTPTTIKFVLTRLDTGEAQYLSPDHHSFKKLLYASSAVPFLSTHVIHNGVPYIDGGLSDPLPIRQALDDGHDEVIVIAHKLTDTPINHAHALSMNVLSLFMDKKVQTFARTKARYFNTLKEQYTHDPRVSIIKPSAKLPLTFLFEDSKEKICASVDLGIRDGYTFLENNSLDKR